MAVRRVALVLLLTVLLTVLLASAAPPSTAEGGEPAPRMYLHGPGEAPAPVSWLYLLDSNITANLTAFLLADRVEGLHELERLNLTIVYRSVEGLNASGTVDCEGGGEGGPLPDVCLWGPDPARRDFTSADCTFRAVSWRLLMQTQPGGPLFLARLTYANETVALEWNATLGPARVLQHARLVLPDNATELQEQRRATVGLVMDNSGGLDVLDQVIDVRYAGRNVATFTVPLVAHGGNHTLEVTLEPVLGGGPLEVHLVQGPGAPYRLALLPLPVRAAPWPLVVDLEVSSRAVEEGRSVTFTATVTNRGNLSASNSTVQFLVDGAIVATATVDGLDPGATTSVTGTWTAKAPGKHAVSARVQGQDLDALVRSVEVDRQSPAPGAIPVLLALAMAFIMRAARR
jgi:uncharacterized repeat protein (TIGR01451 family)